MIGMCIIHKLKWAFLLQGTWHEVAGDHEEKSHEERHVHSHKEAEDDEVYGNLIWVRGHLPATPRTVGAVPNVAAQLGQREAL
jgi:hypothetical protein